MFHRFAARVAGFLVAFAASWACAAPVTDLNGDGTSDLVWFNSSTGQTSVWLMNGGAPAGQSFILSDPNWRVANMADFNGDGKADLLWYNATTGQTAIWLMNGTVPIGSAVVLSDPNWKVAFIADFNGDGKADLLWYNAITGQTVLWLMNGTVATTSALLVADVQWQPVGTPDLDGDGKADLLWRNATTGQTSVWLMNGAAPKSSASLLTDTLWRVTNTPDLNGDGKSDLLWYNESTGQTVAWLMNGTAPVSSAVLLSDLNWKVTATPDLNGDGKADLLWYSAATGQTAAWLMNGTTLISGSLLLSDFSWTVVATPDLNGDGKADLLWFNAAAGRTSTWLMNGTSVVSGPVLLTDPNWRQATQPETAGYSARALNYTDSANYTLRTFVSSGVPDAAGIQTYYDVRVGLASGAPIAPASLYDTALLATPTGWHTFSGSVPNTSSAGSPSHTYYGLGYEFTTTRVDRDVSGQSLASVVAQAQNVSGNSVSTLIGVNAGSLTGTLPPGSRTRTSISVATATPVAYRTSDGTVGLGVTTLASMVAAFPVPSSPTGANTVSMGNLHGSNPCQTTVCVQERVRVAFGPGNATTYYLCDLNQSTNQSFNCGNIGTGTYAPNTAVDGVTPIMNFANLPAATAVKNEVRVFVQRNGVVYYGWQGKFDTTSHTRLNDVAFGAVARQIGITPP